MLYYYNVRLRSGARPQAHLIDYKTFLPDSPAAFPGFRCTPTNDCKLKR